MYEYLWSAPVVWAALVLLVLCSWGMYAFALKRKHPFGGVCVYVGALIWLYLFVGVDKGVLLAEVGHQARQGGMILTFGLFLAGVMYAFFFPQILREAEKEKGPRRPLVRHFRSKGH